MFSDLSSPRRREGSKSRRRLPDARTTLKFERKTGNRILGRDLVARGPSIGLRDASGFSPAQPRVCVGFGGRLASSPSQPRDATAPPAPARLRLPQLVASSSGLCARRPAARRPSPHRPVRPSRAPLQAASGGPRRQHLPPAARAAYPQPASVLGGGASRRPRAWPPAACLDRWTEVEAAGGGVGRRPAPWAAAALRCCAGAAGGLERRAPAASEPARAPSVARCTVSLVLFRPRSLVRLASPL